ncbi:MAG TPA: NFACT family protein [Oculatellaceae cyanobacterium]|jgi:predicted ribosome quality control (RQC) complex YloA/Tae2 family protein
MQQLDALTLKALAAELSLLLDGAKVSKVQHPSAHEFLVTFWGGAERRNLQGEQQNVFYIHLNPELPFCALLTNRERQETVLNTFEKPTALCMLLRKHLNGANVLEVDALPGERVLNLTFENFNELGNKVRLVLSIELMGKHSNMILYDDVQGVILGVAHGVSEKMSSLRELSAGMPYVPPPTPSGKRLLSTLTQADFVSLWQNKPDDESMPTYLNHRLAGFGMRILQDVLEHSDSPTEVYRILSDLEEQRGLLPAISQDGETFTLLPQPNGNWWESLDSVNDLMTTYFVRHLQNSRLKRRRERLLLSLSQREKKWKQRQKELIPVDDAEVAQWQTTGDRLLAAASAGEVQGEKPQSGRVTLTYYETGHPWVIEVDPALSWVENAQLYYRRARKAKSRKATYEQMAEQLEHEKAYLDTLRQLATQADTLAELSDIEADLENIIGKKTASPAPSKKQERLPGIMSLQSSEGHAIWVGKSGQGNDLIVGKLSHPNDIWLHVHQMPGSHVLVRPGKEGLSNQTLLEAATLAVWYSSARDSLNVPVIYTQCKYIRKIPHSYPGHVNYRGEQTVFITPDPALVERLIHPPAESETSHSAFGIMTHES